MMSTTIDAFPLCGGPGSLKDSHGRQVRQGWVGCPYRNTEGGASPSPTEEGQ